MESGASKKKPHRKLSLKPILVLVMLDLLHADNPATVDNESGILFCGIILGINLMRSQVGGFHRSASTQSRLLGLC